MQIPVGRKPAKPAGSITAVLAIGFFNGESYWGPLQSRALGTTVSPTVWWISVAPTLHSCSSPSLYFSALLVSQWVKSKLVLYAYPKRLGTLVIHSALSSPVRKFFVAGEFPLDIQQCLRAGKMPAKWSCSSFPFYTGFSQVFFFAPLCH